MPSPGCSEVSGGVLLGCGEVGRGEVAGTEFDLEGCIAE